MRELVWWEIESREPAAFQQFASDLFGWRFESAFENTQLAAEYWIVRHGDRSIGGLQKAAETASPAQVGTRIDSDVDDLEVRLPRSYGWAGKVERSRTHLGGDDRWFATFTDPTGVSIGLWTARPARR